MAGKVASPGQAGYAASKHALNGFFHSLRCALDEAPVPGIQPAPRHLLPHALRAGVALGVAGGGGRRALALRPPRWRRSEVSDRGVGVTVICPGPVATGAPGQPRVTFGATLGSSLLAADKEGKGGAAEGAGAGAPAGKEEKHRMSVRHLARSALPLSAP